MSVENAEQIAKKYIKQKTMEIAQRSEERLQTEIARLEAASKQYIQANIGEELRKLTIATNLLIEENLYNEFIARCKSNNYDEKGLKKCQY